MARHGAAKAAAPPPPPPPTTSAPTEVSEGAEQIGVDAVDLRETVGSMEGEGKGGPAERSRKSKRIGEQGFFADPSIGGDLDKLIKKNLMDRVQGKNPKFSAEIMQHMKEKLFKETQGQTRRARMSLMADAARRGVFRSGATGGLIRDVEIAGIQAYSSGVKDLLIQKAMSDHEDMIKAIDAAQTWLANTRQYQLGLEQNDIARQQVKATIAAASMMASASRYAADQGLKGARAGAGAMRAGQQQAFQDSRQVIRNSDTGKLGYAKGPNNTAMSQSQYANMDWG